MSNNQKNCESFYFRVGITDSEELVDAEIVSFVPKKSNDSFSFYYEKLNCRVVNFLPISEKLDLIIDDEGLFTSNNPIFDISNKFFAQNLRIVGSFLIGKRVEHPIRGTETIGFSSEQEIWDMLGEEADLKFQLIGRFR